MTRTSVSPLPSIWYGTFLDFESVSLEFVRMLVGTRYNVRTATAVLSKNMKTIKLFPMDFFLFFASEKKSLFFAWASFRNAKTLQFALHCLVK